MPRKKKVTMAQIEAEYIEASKEPVITPPTKSKKELTEAEIIDKFRAPHPQSPEFATRPNLSLEDLAKLVTKYKSLTTGLSTIDKLQVAENANWAMKLAGKSYVGDDPEYEDEFEPEDVNDEVAKLIVEKQKPFSKFDKEWWTSGKNRERQGDLIEAIVRRDGKISVEDYRNSEVLYYLKIRLADL
jgi:hypothetical protein